jgi:hypothetical protein
MAAPGQAVPGTVVTGGAFASPGGPQGTVGGVGPQGPQGNTGASGPPASTTTTANFTVPNIGATTTVTVLDASWIVPGQMVYVASAGGGTSAGALQVTAKTGNSLTLLNPATISAIPPADNTQPGLLNLLSGNTTDFVDGTNHCQPLSSIPPATNARAGLLNLLSGNATDFVGGDNVCHSLAAISTFITKTGAYALTPGDSGKYVILSGGSWTLTLPSPILGLNYRLRNDMGISGTTGTITLQPTGGTIDGASTLALLPQQECTLITDGTNWRTHGLKREVILGTQDITSSTATGTVLLPVGYRAFELSWDNITAGTDNAHLACYFSVNGGSTWWTTVYYYQAIYNSTATATTTSGTAAGVNLGYLGWYIGGPPGGYGICRLKLNPGRANMYPTYLTESGSFASTNGFPNRNVHYGLVTTGYGPINALQYFLTTGNIVTSFLTVKGVV